MSRLQLANEAVRPNLKARMMLSGPSGAGKTLTAIEIAKTLTSDNSRILVMDTEKDSALTYADVTMRDGKKFTHLPWDAPYAPRELAQTLNEAGNVGTYDVAIVDSLTHFWTKQGGTLDMADGRFGGWKSARPAQEEMVDAILGTNLHVIVCVRAKVEYTQEYNERTRKQEVRKIGMAPQQDTTLDYEMNIAAEMDLEHNIFISKSRTTEIPVGRTYPAGRGSELAGQYADWLKGGVEIASITLEALRSRLNTLPGPVRDRMLALWQERNLPALEYLNPQQVLRVVGIIDQVESEFARTAPLAQSPQAQPQTMPTQQPEQQYLQQAPPGDAASAAVQRARQQGGDPQAINAFRGTAQGPESQYLNG
ncbi:AAA-ATPase [Arthrobacter phage Waltz]|nr:AAA-ATPase [Arthrobacter phage Waltz]